MKDKTGNESDSVPNATVQTTCTSLIRSLLTVSLMVLWGKWLSSVESFCWNVEILQGQEAMAEVDQKHLRMCPSLGNWNTAWNGKGTLWNSTAAPGTIGWKQMNYCLNFLDAI